jgi:gamma-butyrobetaine dioxygenase
MRCVHCILFFFVFGGVYRTWFGTDDVNKIQFKIQNSIGLLFLYFNENNHITSHHITPHCTAQPAPPPDDGGDEQCFKTGAVASEGRVTVRWGDASGWTHESSYDLAWLRAHVPGSAELRRSRAARAARRRQLAWSRFPKDECSFAYGDVLATEEARRPGGPLDGLLESLDKHGLVFVDGCPTTPRSTLPMAEAIGGIVRPTFYGEDFTVEVKPAADNLAYTGHAIVLHQDLLYFETPPGLQFLLAAEQTITRGGETFFVDGYRVAENLRKAHPEHFETLATVPVTYRYRFGNERRQRTRTVIDTDPHNGRMTLAYSPPWMGINLFEDARDAERLYAALVAFDREAAALEPVSLRLPRGRCAVFDNRRILHGRHAFELQPGEARVLQGCYADIDDFESGLRHRREVRRILAGDAGEL